MAMSELQAWTIFKASILGQEEGEAAVNALLGDEAAEYEAHTAKFQASLAEKVIEIQNECVALTVGNPVVQYLELIPAYDLTANDYRKLVGLFEGSKYEKLHLTAFLRIQNQTLLLDLVKPAA